VFDTYDYPNERFFICIRFQFGAKGETLEY